jgi:protein O-mannosyl-transferase
MGTGNPIWLTRQQHRFPCVANALIVLLIARGICHLRTFGAAFAAVLFAVLPVHAPAMAWISGRADSIPSLFYLSAFLCYAVWRRKGGRRFYVASLVLCFLALYSKQSAITFALTIISFDLLVERHVPRWT